MWVLEQGSADHALAWLQAHYLREHVDFDGAAVLLKAAIRAPEPDYFTQLLDVQIFELARGELNHGQHAVSFSYDGLCVRAMRALQGRFHKPAAAWQVRGEVAHIQHVLRDLAGMAPEYTFVHEQPVVLEELVSSSADESPIQVPAATPEQGESGPAQDVDGAGFLSADLEQSNAVDIDEAVLAAIAVGAGLREYQVDGVRHLAGQTGACLGDDMGLGKTRQTVVGARLAAGQGRVLIVCPASLRINWEREIHAVYPDAVVGFAGDDRISTLYGCQWVIANYERLGGLVREVELEFGAMAIDEAHYLKEHKSGRTRNAFVMATRIPKRYVVTGTPLLNREIELHTLLRLTGHPLGRMELKEFRKEFTGSRDRRAALARALGGWMLRRRKDVLDLGAKTHSVRYISPSEGLAAYKEIYDDMSLMAMPKITKLRLYVDQNKKTVYNQLVILIFYLFLRLYSPMYPPLGYGVSLSGVHTSASRFMVSGNFSTRRISRAAWALGLARPCSQFSRVRGLVRR